MLSTSEEHLLRDAIVSRMIFAKESSQLVSVLSEVWV